MIVALLEVWQIMSVFQWQATYVTDPVDAFSIALEKCTTMVVHIG